MRIAVIAYSYEPNKGSEPGVAWDFVKEMNERGHELVVFTKADKRENIEKSPISDNVNIQFVASPDVWFKTKIVPLRILHYYVWNIVCVIYFKKRFKKSDFDLVHHVTFVNDWTPSAGAFLGVRFVLGPIGRHPNLPLQYLESLRFKDAGRELLRRAFRGIASLFGVLTHFTHRQAETIFVINAESINPKFSCKTHVLPAIAIDCERFSVAERRRGDSEAFRLYWAGNFIYWKGPEVAIMAFIKAREIDRCLELHMFGASGDFPRILAKYRNVDGLFFHGRKAQQWFFEEIAEMDAFLYPSFEGGGMVVLEAMASGKPVIGIRFGGVAQMVTIDSGRVVDFKNIKTTVTELAHEIITLANDRELTIHLSEGARLRANEFSVQCKCKLIEQRAYL